MLKLAISTHTLTWSVTNRPWNFCATGKIFQLTRSRGAWPAPDVQSKFYDSISTHTLTWSVTGKYNRIPISERISTHTLTWSVTTRIPNYLSKCRISTHTLTWSVTLNVSDVQNNLIHFNSHAHVERDFLVILYVYHSCNFNSHAHVERDDRPILNAPDNYGFQLTRSRGAWQYIKKVATLQLGISTHTLTWSVTKRKNLRSMWTGFQLTRSRGAWPC